MKHCIQLGTKRACHVIGKTLEEALAMARAVTEVTRDQPEGLKGAAAVCVHSCRCRILAAGERLRVVALLHVQPSTEPA